MPSSLTKPAKSPRWEAVLPAFARAMLQPRFYPHGPRRVQFIQTHISYVFLAGDMVYKVKKAVDFGFLDYSTLRKRSLWCRRETELNRRLAPDTYLGVAKIFLKKEGYSLRPPGKVVEYAVVMKRLPEDRLLSSLMSRGKATTSHVRRIARRMASFHGDAAEASARNRRLSVLRRNLEENFRQTKPYIGKTVTASDYSEVYAYNTMFLTDRIPLLRRRIRSGRLRDGHGDLHAQHICLSNGITIYDCLEFNSRLRQTDVAAEVAFLYMDLLYHRHPHLARAFAEEYIDATGDWEIRLLLSFYACYRAVVREKVESLRFSDPHVPKSQKTAARHRAARYFHLARNLARRDGKPRLFAVGGLPGTGKSTFSRLWSQRLGAAWINSDAVRKELAGTGRRPARPEGYRTGIYSPGWTRRTYAELVGRASELLEQNHSVVLDATFARRTYRRMAAAAARKAGARLVTVECLCREETVRRRLRKRAEAGDALSDADWSIYLAKKKEYTSPRRETVRIDTDLPLEKGLARIAEAAFPL